MAKIKVCRGLLCHVSKPRACALYTAICVKRVSIEDRFIYDTDSRDCALFIAFGCHLTAPINYPETVNSHVRKKQKKNGQGPQTTLLYFM